MVPHLITALTGPINELEQRMLESLPAIERWFRLEWQEHTPPFYSSVDLRNAGFQLPARLQVGVDRGDLEPCVAQVDGRIERGGMFTSLQHEPVHYRRGTIRPLRHDSAH